MYLPCFDDVKKLTEELVKIPSIVKTSGEADCARRIHQFYRSLPYFQRNPEYLWLQRTEDDEIEVQCAGYGQGDEEEVPGAQSSSWAT